MCDCAQRSVANRSWALADMRMQALHRQRSVFRNMHVSVRKKQQGAHSNLHIFREASETLQAMNTSSVKQRKNSLNVHTFVVNGTGRLLPSLLWER